jgi:hypothetical protein
VDRAVFGEAAKHGVGFGVWVGWGFGFGGVGISFEGWWGGLAGCVGTFHSTVHGFVGETIGVLVFVAEGVRDLEGFESGDTVSGFLPERFEVWRAHLIFTLDLLDHQLRVGDDAEAGVVMIEGVLEAGEETGVFGVVIGSDTEELAEFGDDHPLVVLNEGPEAGWAWVATGSAVAVGVDPDGLCGVGRWLGGGWIGEETGRGGTGRHGVSLPLWC